jgi:hypothetical protein
MSEPLSLLEGVFHDVGDDLSVLSGDGEDRSVNSALTEFEGDVVHLSLHHLPPTPVLPAPGGGACLWAGHCPCGHESDSAWLYSLNLRGVLTRSESGKWAVKGEPIPLTHYMLGHRGRLVLFRDMEVSPDKGVGDLLEEAESMLGVLEGLRGAIQK